MLLHFAHAVVRPTPGFDTITLKLESSPCTVIAPHCAAGRRMEDECAMLFRLRNSRNSPESINQFGACTMNSDRVTKRTQLKAPIFDGRGAASVDAAGVGYLRGARPTL